MPRTPTPECTASCGPDRWDAFALARGFNRPTRSSLQHASCGMDRRMVMPTNHEIPTGNVPETSSRGLTVRARAIRKRLGGGGLVFLFRDGFSEWSCNFCLMSKMSFFYF